MKQRSEGGKREGIKRGRGIKEEGRKVKGEKAKKR